jgi:hypothetical protein
MPIYIYIFYYFLFIFFVDQILHTSNFPFGIFWWWPKIQTVFKIKLNLKSDIDRPQGWYLYGWNWCHQWILTWMDANMFMKCNVWMKLWNEAKWISWMKIIKSTKLTIWTKLMFETYIPNFFWSLTKQVSLYVCCILLIRLPLYFTNY